MAIETSTSAAQAEMIPQLRLATDAPRQHAKATGPRVRIADVILLGASVRSELAEATERTRADLPLDAGSTLLNQWQRQVAQWMNHDDQLACAMRLLVPPASPLPRSADDAIGARPRLERDPHECRGTGGLLRDLAADYNDDQWLLIASASQVLLEPLDELIESLRRIEGDVRLLAHADGTPVGMMLVRCGCLRVLEPIGFIDFKEQGLPRIARSHRVGFKLCNQPTCLPVRNPREYIRAVRWHHLRHANPAALVDPFAEDWRSTFAITESGATIDASARLHDSIVLSGGRVGANATVVRSIICPGAVVPRGSVVIDQLVRSR